MTTRREQSQFQLRWLRANLDLMDSDLGDVRDVAEELVRVLDSNPAFRLESLTRASFAIERLRGEIEIAVRLIRREANNRRLDGDLAGDEVA